MAAAAETVPLEALRLSPQGVLETAARQPCPVCGKPRAYYCYDCLLPLLDGTPAVPLPVSVHVVMHGETNAQSTGAHAAVLAPRDVKMFRHADGTGHHRRQPAGALALPDWDPRTTAVLFPEAADTPVVGHWGQLLPGAAAAQQHPEQQQQQQPKQEQQHGGSGGAFPYRTVVVLEGSWHKARVLLQHPKIAPLPRVQLPPNVRSVFWRRGDGTHRDAVDCGLCTIEAVYVLCRQLRPEPPGAFDDLLWLFTHQRRLVEMHGSGDTRRKMHANYTAARVAGGGGGDRG